MVLSVQAVWEAGAKKIKTVNSHKNDEQYEKWAVWAANSVR